MDSIHYCFTKVKETGVFIIEGWIHLLGYGLLRTSELSPRRYTWMHKCPVKPHHWSENVRENDITSHPDVTGQLDNRIPISLFCFSLSESCCLFSCSWKLQLKEHHYIHYDLTLNNRAMEKNLFTRIVRSVTEGMKPKNHTQDMFIFSETISINKRSLKSNWSLWW